MFIDEVGASDQINNIGKVRKNNASRVDNVKKSSGDKLDISRSSEFQLIMKDAIAQAPEVREDKVREISQKLEKNEYNVPSRDIAKKIIEADEYDGVRSELFG